MAWTAATRGDYVRPSGSYASDVTDREWTLIAPLLPAARMGGRPRTTCLRRVVNAIFYVLQAGCQWRMLPGDFPPRGTVYGYFRAWIAAGVWAHVHDVLYRRTRELKIAQSPRGVRGWARGSGETSAPSAHQFRDDGGVSRSCR